MSNLILVKVEYILEMFEDMFNTPTHEVEVDNSIKVERGVSREDDMEVFLILIFFAPSVKEDNHFDRDLAVHEFGLKGIYRNRGFSTII